MFERIFIKNIYQLYRYRLTLTTNQNHTEQNEYSVFRKYISAEWVALKQTDFFFCLQFEFLKSLVTVVMITI